MAKQHVVSSARELAARVHADQRFGDQPLIERLDEVAALVQPHGDVAQTVAYLGHVLDYTDTSIEQLEAEFGPVVAQCAVLMSAGRDASAKERSRAVYAKLESVAATDECAVALIVATAERLLEAQSYFVNADRGGLRRLRRDHREFRAAVHRPELAPELWRELTELIAT